MNTELSSTNSSYGRWAVTYDSVDAFGHPIRATKYFWRRHEAVAFMGDNGSVLPQLERLLDESVSEHRCWLLDNRKVIAKDLSEAIQRGGYETTLRLIKERESPFCRNLYAKIREAVS